jgi:hypothetical protein
MMDVQAGALRRGRQCVSCRDIVGVSRTSQVKGDREGQRELDCVVSRVGFRDRERREVRAVRREDEMVDREQRDLALLRHGRGAVDGEHVRGAG